jgi:BASS family bile acid:Na+ symporter
MRFLLNIIKNRNSVLVLALICGFIFGQHSTIFKPYTLYILALVMIFSMTGMRSKDFFPIKRVVKPVVWGSFLNYIIFGIVVLTLAYFIVPDSELFLGFVVIVAAPPGVAVIPFTHMLKGDVNYSILGVFGAFLASIFMAPIIIGLFTESGTISPMVLFVLMVKLIIVPLIISRFLLHKSVIKGVEKVRGKIVDWGFGLIIFTAVGLNRDVFFDNFDIIARITVVLALATFGLGFIYRRFISLLFRDKTVIISHVLLATIKSSGFSVVTAFSLFGKKAAIPSAVLAVIVLLYLLYYIFIQAKKR